MRVVAIYPGRFHPFHRGHFASHEYLVRRFGAGNVFIVSTNTQAPLTSPFSFEDKKAMMTALGVHPNKIVQVKNPYAAQEVTSQFDPEKTAVVFAVSEKDANRFSFGTKKDGFPSYLQPMSDKIELQPLSKHGYVEIVPTVTFKVMDSEAISATKIRQMYMAADESGREQIISDLYGEFFPKIKKIFDRKLGVTESISAFIDTYRPLILESKTAASRIEKILSLEREANNEFLYPGDL